MVEYIVYDTPKRSSHYAVWVAAGILVLIAIVLPFVAPTLRYQLGDFFQVIFDTIGMFCLFFGAIFTALGFFGLLMRRIQLSFLVVGGLLLWIGCWLTGVTIDIFGFVIGGEQISDPGYH